MAEKIELVLRREGKRVRYWDKNDRNENLEERWKEWGNSEEFSPPGQPAYKVVGSGDLQFLQRGNKRKLNYSKQIPEGVSTWGPEGGALATLPWTRKNQISYTLAMLGIPIDAKTLVRQPETVTELKLSTAENRIGDRFSRHVVTDGHQTVTSMGVKITTPTYAVEIRRYPDWKGRAGRREIACIHVWEHRVTGGGINPAVLRDVLLGLGLSHKLQDWERALYRETFKKKIEE